MQSLLHNGRVPRPLVIAISASAPAADRRATETPTALGPVSDEAQIRAEAERRALAGAQALERVLRATSGQLLKRDEKAPEPAKSVQTHAEAAVRRLFTDYEHSGVPMTAITELVIRYGAPRVTVALKAMSPFQLSHGRLFRGKGKAPLVPADTTTAGTLTDAVVGLTGVGADPGPPAEGVQGPKRMPDPPMAKSNAHRLNPRLLVKSGEAAPSSYVVPTAARAAARRGLGLRRQWKRGGLDNAQASAEGIGSGVQRASNLANGRRLTLETVKRMHAFFERHEKNYAPGKKEKDGGPTAGTIAWLLWGGDPARAWAKRIVSSDATKALSALAVAPSGPVTGQQLPAAWPPWLDEERKQVVKGGMQRATYSRLLVKAEKEVQPKGYSKAPKPEKDPADDPRSDPVGTRKIWNKRVVQKLSDGKWHVVGGVAGLEDAPPVTQLDTRQLSKDDVAHLLKQLLKLREVKAKIGAA